MNTGISICIPTYNRARLLGQTLESIKKVVAPPGVAVEVIVIDNQCTDDTPAVVAKMIEGFPYPLRRVSETQPGANHSRNRALDEARYEHLVFFDDDVNVSPHWLTAYLEAVEILQSDCVVGPVSPQFEKAVPSYITPRVLDSLISSYSQKGTTMRLLSDNVAHELPGCCFGVRKKVACEVGRFSPGLDRIGKKLIAGGDFEFGQRLVKNQKRVVYQPACSVLHFISKEKLSKDHLRRRWRGLGTTQRLVKQNRPRFPGLLSSCRQLFGITRRFALAMFWRILGRQALSFEEELEGWKGLGYFTGR